MIGLEYQIYRICGLRFPACVYHHFLIYLSNLPIHFTTSEGCLDTFKFEWTCFIMANFRLAVLITTIVRTVSSKNQDDTLKTGLFRFWLLCL